MKPSYLGGGKDAGLGKCLTEDNPGYDTTPIFSPDGTKLAWLTMAGPTYESDAIGIMMHDLETGETSTLLKAEEDFEHSPYTLTWSKDGDRLYFTTDMRSRRALCSIGTARGAKGGITVHTSEASLSLHGELSHDNGERKFLTTVQSLTMPSELFLTTTSLENNKEKGATQRQITHFNTQTIAETALGRPGEIIYKGAKDEDVQAWLVRPAGLTREDEDAIANGKEPSKKYPMAVLYHGGPQGSTGDDWHYRWNLQYYASMGFAVLAPNFHGSTGFGHQFCRDISENWEVGGIDTIAGVRAALEKYPWIDGTKVVGLGASYGGYTSNWLNGNAPKNMFAALVCHCGTFDLRSSYYATEGTNRENRNQTIETDNFCGDAKEETEPPLVVFEILNQHSRFRLFFFRLFFSIHLLPQSSFSWKPNSVGPPTPRPPSRRTARTKSTPRPPRSTSGKPRRSSSTGPRISV